MRSSLQSGTRGGPLVHDTRGWRVQAHADGKIVIHEPDGRERLVAPPGEVARVVNVSSDDLSRRITGRWRTPGVGHDVVSFLGDDSVLLSVPLRHVRLGQTDVENNADMRATSGVADVALFLGLTLESATPADARRVNAAPRAVTRGTTVDALHRRRRLHRIAGVWLLLAFLFIFVGNGSYATGIGVSAAMAPATLFLGVEAWRRSSAFFNHSPTGTDRRTLIPNVAGTERWAWLRESQLQIGDTDIVHTRHVLETWLPGPARGGVARCAVSDDAIWFLDRHDVVLTVLPAEAWVPPEEGPVAIQDACRAAGVQFTHYSGIDLPGFQAAALDPAVYASPEALLYLVPTLDRGALFFGGGLFVAFFSLVQTSIATGTAFAFTDLSAPGLVAVILIAAAGAAVFAAMCIMQVRASRWNRRQMSAESAQGDA